MLFSLRTLQQNVPYKRNAVTYVMCVALLHFGYDFILFTFRLRIDGDFLQNIGIMYIWSCLKYNMRSITDTE